MSDKLLDQADALMRRRSFVAGTAATEFDEQAGHAAGTELEEVPVLTDVVGDGAVREQHHQPPDDAGKKIQSEARVALQIESAVRQRIDQLLSDRQDQLAREIEAWLDQQMPQLVIRAMDGITDHLVALLTNRAKDELLPRLEATMRKSDEDSDDASVIQ